MQRLMYSQYGYKTLPNRIELTAASLSVFGSNSASLEVRVAPVSHGVYRIGVRLADGQSIWSDFLHSNVGERRRVDVFLSPSLRPGYIHFRQTASRKTLLFEGDTLRSDATEQKPFRLDWI
jgi:hypothetical protein